MRRTAVILGAALLVTVPQIAQARPRRPRRG